MLLIVDDDPAFLMSAEKQFNEGRGVFFAGNANDAKALIGALRPGGSRAREPARLGVRHRLLRRRRACGFAQGAEQ